MNDDVFMYIAIGLYFICYVPGVYADFKNKNANIYNLPEKIVSLCGTTFGLIYSVRINNIPLIVNYAPHLIMEVFTLLFKMQYIVINWYENRNISIIEDINLYSGPQPRMRHVSVLVGCPRCAAASQPRIEIKDNSYDIENPIHLGDSNAITEWCNKTRRELQAMHAEPVEELESRLVSKDGEAVLGTNDS